MRVLFIICGILFSNSAHGESKMCLSPFALFSSFDRIDESQLQVYTQSLIESGVLTDGHLRIFLESGSIPLDSIALHVHSDLLRSLENLHASEDGSWVRGWIAAILDESDRELRNKSFALDQTSIAERPLKMVKFADSSSNAIVEVSDTHVTLGLYAEVMGLPLDEFGMLRRRKLEDSADLSSLPVYGLTNENIVDFLNKYSLKNGLDPFFRNSDVDGFFYGPIEDVHRSIGYRLPTSNEIKTLLQFDLSEDVNRSDFGWYLENTPGLGVVQPVAKLKPIVVHGEQIFDLRGNVRNLFLDGNTQSGAPLSFVPYGWFVNMGSRVEPHYSECVSSLNLPCGFRVARTIDGGGES